LCRPLSAVNPWCSPTSSVSSTTRHATFSGSFFDSGVKNCATALPVLVSGLFLLGTITHLSSSTAASVLLAVVMAFEIQELLALELSRY